MTGQFEGATGMLDQMDLLYRYQVYRNMHWPGSRLSFEEWKALEDIGHVHGPWRHEINRGCYSRGRVRVPWPGHPAGRFRRP